MKKNDFKTLFLERYPDRESIVTYVYEALDKETVLLKDFTRVNIGKIADTINANVISNTARTYFSLIKAFLNLYKEEGIPCSKYTDLLHAKRLPSQNIYLTEQEIEKLEAYLLKLIERPVKRCKDLSEIDTLHLFLEECYCGARGCDVAAFTQQNIHNDYLMYISKKTQVLSKLPIHRNFMQHFQYEKNKEHDPSVMVKIMKRVCKACGITQEMTLFYRGKMQTHPKCYYVGQHTARRSFATNLHLHNVPLALIAQMMNHGNDMAMTQRYIVADINALDENAMAFFK